MRNTPTSVGKTDCLLYCTASGKKHPHERGEDWLTGVKSHSDEGNTPTSVGKTGLGPV